MSQLWKFSRTSKKREHTFVFGERREFGDTLFERVQVRRLARRLGGIPASAALRGETMHGPKDTNAKMYVEKTR